MINIKDFQKVELMLAEVKEISRDGVLIDSGDKMVSLKLELDVEVGDKIIVGLLDDGLIVPLVGGMVLQPDGDLPVGSKVS
jgi:hypothetical protein